MTRKFVLGLNLPEELIERLKKEAEKDNGGNNSMYCEKVLRIGLGLDEEFKRRFDALEKIIKIFESINMDYVLSNDKSGIDGF